METNQETQDNTLPKILDHLGRIWDKFWPSFCHIWQIHSDTGWQDGRCKHMGENWVRAGRGGGGAVG